MKLRRAGALITLVLATGAGIAGVYAAWSLVAGGLHPRSVIDTAGTANRVIVAEPPRLVAVAAKGGEEPATSVAAPVAADPAPPLAEPAKPEDTEEPELEPADPRVYPEGSAAAAANKRGIVILQIGDSHTSADFLSGELRRRLQARYGKGGPGYLPAGKPHIGVRSSSLNIKASAGWTYKSLQRPDAKTAEFWMSGYSAIATAAGETLSFSSEKPVVFDMIEIEVVGQRGGGAIDIALDGKVETHYDLAASRIEPVVIRLLPTRGPTEKVREISIRTTGQGTVNIGSVAIYNNRSGVTYHSVGYVGATVGLVNKLNDKLFASDLTRIDPKIVVLAFGTNEASNESLDLAAYGKSYERVINKIKAALPDAVIVVVSPPDFAELPAHCRREKVAEATCRRMDVTASTAAHAAAAAGASDCVWRTPTKLNQIRDVQRDIAKRYRLVYWNWASIMPSECGAHQWFSSTPPLMAKDHVHFTIDGYKKSADQFLNTLIPIIEKVRVGADVIPNN